MSKCLCGCGLIAKPEKKYIQGHYFKNMINSQAGKPKSDKHCKNISIGRTGIKLSDKVRKIIKESQNRPEVKKKKSESQTKAMIKKWQDLEYRNKQIRKSTIWQDTKPECLLHDALIKKDLRIIKQYYVKDVGLIDRYLPDLNLVVEVDGDYFHCNPKIFKANDYNKTIKMIAKEKWNVDKIKTEKLKQLGFNVLRFWESDIYNNLEKCLNKIKRINNEKILAIS